MNKDIIEKTNELVECVKSSDKYKKYLEISKKIKENNEIMLLINKIKSLQKEAVRKEYNKEDISSIDEEINNLLSELKEYPIYLEMTYLEEDLNNLFMVIKETLDNYISKQIN